MIFTSITCILKASFVNYVRYDGFLCNVSKFMKSATDFFSQKKFLEDIFVIDRIN